MDKYRHCFSCIIDIITIKLLLGHPPWLVVFVASVGLLHVTFTYENSDKKHSTEWHLYIYSEIEENFNQLKFQTV